MGKIFISYRRDDSHSITGRIYDRLKKHFNENQLFKDVDSIPVGVDFLEYTNNNLSGAKVFLPIIGNNWASSLMKRKDDPNDFVRIELEEALSQDLKIIPVFVEGTKSPKPEELPESIRQISYFNGISIRPDPDFEADVQKLIGVIQPEIDNIGDTIIRKLKRSTKVFVVLGIMLFSIVYFINRTQPIPEIICEDHMKAILLTNFEDETTYGESFASTIKSNLKEDLNQTIYDIHGVGNQSLDIPRYNDKIRESYFLNSCDTSGMFVNGYLNSTNKAFNLNLVVVNLEIPLPDFIQDNSLVLTNPTEFKFSLKEDATFVSNYIKSLIFLHEGKSFEALELVSKSYAYYKKENKENNIELEAHTSYVKGVSYAMSGDENRAEKEFKIVEKSSNKELKNAATINKKQAKSISQKYRDDPEMAKVRVRNISRHKSLEQQIFDIFQEGLKQIKKFFNSLK